MYSLIIGLSPSKGARSPILWNRAFKKYNINCLMSPLDIPSIEDLKNNIQRLKEDNLFLGGSVTFPYKELVAEILFKNLENEATKKINSVNSLYRNESGELCAGNTDGMAALNCIEKKFFMNFKQPTKILVLGGGGVGKAVISFLHDQFLIEKKNIQLFNSSRKKNISFESKFNNCKFVEWGERNKVVDSSTLIVNCTSMGDYENIDLIPLDIREIIKDKYPFGIYDVIYNPLKSKLIKFAEENNIIYENGLEMNLLQAAIAFKLATRISDSIEDISLVMSKD